MKLSEIDRIQGLKDNYLYYRAQLRALEGTSGMSLMVGGVSIDANVVREDVRAAARAAMQKHVDLLKTQLTMVGVTDFEEK